MKELLSILFLTPFLLPLLYSQESIHLKNPSFESIPAEGRVNGDMPKGWINCGFAGESAPDVHPVEGGGTFQVTMLPADSRTYLGMVARDNNTWERIGQRLENPLQPGVTYSFSIFLCRSENYVSLSKTTGQETNLNKPLQLRIWGGHSQCDRVQLLAESPPVNNTSWKQYDFLLTPDDPYEFLVFESYFSSIFSAPYSGNILLDKSSPLVPADSAHIVEMPEDSLENRVTIPDVDRNRHEYTRNLMGTEFRIILYNENDSLADMAAARAFEKITAVEAIMSDYQEDSELSRLNLSSSGIRKAVQVSEELYHVLSFSQHVSKKSKGAFDVTAGALTKHWRRAFRQKEFPIKADIEMAKNRVDYRRLKLYKQHFVKLDLTGMQLDLGGIAKGYAIDEAMKILDRHGISSALIDGGGDILAGNPPPKHSYWTIEMPFFRDGKKQSVSLDIANGAVATSGDTYRYLEHEGKRYSHIIDPRTGYGVNHQMLVTVQAPTCMEADAWATALSVDLNTDIYLWLKDQPDYEVYFSERNIR